MEEIDKAFVDVDSFFAKPAPPPIDAVASSDPASTPVTVTNTSDSIPPSVPPIALIDVVAIACSHCNATASTIWRKGIDGERLCNSCFLRQQRNSLSAVLVGASGSSAVTNRERPSSRSSSTVARTNGSKKESVKPTPAAQASSSASSARRPGRAATAKDKSRRSVCFKTATPTKAPTVRATTRSSGHVWHRGQLFRVGDVVAMVDAEDGREYFAQLRGFLTDEYAAKSAAVTWLLPTENAPSDGSFDARSFVLGPAEELARPLDCMKLLCRPSTLRC